MAKIRIEWIGLLIAVVLVGNWQLGHFSDLPAPTRPLEERALAHALDLGVNSQRHASLEDLFDSDDGCYALFKMVMDVKSAQAGAAPMVALSATAKRNQYGHMFCDYEFAGGVRVQYYANGEVLCENSDDPSKS